MMRFYVGIALVAVGCRGTSSDPPRTESRPAPIATTPSTPADATVRAVDAPPPPAVDAAGTDARELTAADLADSLSSEVPERELAGHHLLLNSHPWVDTNPLLAVFTATDVTSCWEAGRKVQADVSFHVDANGKVSNLRVDGLDSHADPTERCLMKVIAAHRFPAPLGDDARPTATDLVLTLSPR